MDAITAHEYCNNNKKAINNSKYCGCFYCLEVFLAKDVKEFIDGKFAKVDDTALCPKCGIDAVICDQDVDINKSLLQAMNKHWF